MGDASLASPGFEAKAQVVTPLTQAPFVDPRSEEALRGLSVTSVEELLGLIAADPDAVAEFLPELDLPQVQADADSVARAPVLAEFESYEKPEFTMGAWAPEDVEVEERASAAYVEEWLPEATADVGLEETEQPVVSLIECFGPIRDQEERGTCVGHAVCAVLECQEARLKGERNDLSEQFVYWNAKENDGYPEVEGTWLRVSVPLTERDGACLERVWPYRPSPIPGNEGQGPPPAGAQQDALDHLLVDPLQLDPRDPAAMRSVLDEGRPIAFSVPVYNNWYSNPAANALGLLPMPLPNSVRKGGHALCIAGYGWDPDFAGGGFFIVRNSWGTDWAPQSPIAPGYGAIPFLYIKRYGWESWTTASGA
jgi:C1A family cysteine protease